MRRNYFFLFAIALFLSPFSAIGQTLYTAEFGEKMGIKEPMSIRRKVEKPGMTADEIYRSFLFPKHCRRADMGFVGGIDSWRTMQSYRQVFFNVERATVSFGYYIYAFDGYYIVSLERILVQGYHTFTIYGADGVPFKDVYSKRDYKMALKIIDFTKSKFEEICAMLEEKAFCIQMTEN